MEKHCFGRKKRRNGKENKTEMKGGKKWELEELIWEFKTKNCLNKDQDLLIS